jgi:uncharacterized protein (DUF58 family)
MASPALDKSPAPEARAPTAPGAAIDPRALMAIRNLELRARVVVEGFWSGLHRSPFHGFSVEFTEYRQYSPGDDLRYLDWRLFARTDRYYLKRFQEETNLRAHLLVDQSRSMAFGTMGYTKAQYATTLAATLAWFLHEQGDAVGVLTFDQELRDFLPARHRAAHLRQLMLHLERPAMGRATNLSAPLRRIVEIVRKRGLMILISDLLAPTETLEQDLSALTACGHEVMLFHVLDPAELRFAFDEPVVFEDAESGRELLLDPVAARAQYMARLGAHAEAAEFICRKLGASYRRFATDQPLELALFDFLRERLQRGRVVHRRAAPGRRA